MELAGSALRLEERGAAFSFEALRAAYAMGGDGESDIRIDVQHLAAFVRDPAACVTCFLLPTSFHAHVQMEVCHCEPTAIWPALAQVLASRAGHHSQLPTVVNPGTASPDCNG